MFDPTTNKIIVSRNAAFEEDREWGWNFLRWNKIGLGENIEIDKNIDEEEEIIEETTELAAETIESVAKNKE